MTLLMPIAALVFIAGAWLWYFVRRARRPKLLRKWPASHGFRHEGPRSDVQVRHKRDQK